MKKQFFLVLSVSILFSSVGLHADDAKKRTPKSIRDKVINGAKIGVGGVFAIMGMNALIWIRFGETDKELVQRVFERLEAGRPGRETAYRAQGVSDEQIAQFEAAEIQNTRGWIRWVKSVSRALSLVFVVGGAVLVSNGIEELLKEEGEVEPISDSDSN